MPFTSDRSVFDDLLAVLLTGGGEFADLFLEERWSRSAGVTSGHLGEPTLGFDAGIGMRIVEDGSVRYTYLSAPDRDGAMAAARRLAGGFSDAGVVMPGDPERSGDAPTGPVGSEPDARASTQPEWRDDLNEMLTAVDDGARETDPAIDTTWSRYREVLQRVTVASSDGTFATDTRARFTLQIRCGARDGGRRGEGHSGAGGSAELTNLDIASAAALGRGSAERAVERLGAVQAPSGRMPVVLAGGWGGVLFHEVCGHALEADVVARGASFLGRAGAPRTGDRVGPETLTLVDDPTRTGLRGSYEIDDEGNRAERVVLIDRGRVAAALNDRRTAGALGVTPNGHARRDSYRSLPIPRMSNTFIEQGSVEPDEIIRDAGNGIYVTGIEGGTVDTARGDFTFSVRDGYLIEDGRLTAPIARTTIIGNGANVLRSVEQVGNDLTFEPGYSNCSKEGQYVPVAVGQPTVLVRGEIGGLIVGGSEASHA